MNDFPAGSDIILTLEGTVTCCSVQQDVPKCRTSLQPCQYSTTRDFGNINIGFQIFGPHV